MGLFYRRKEPYFMAFDIPYLDGRELPLLERKRILRGIVPADSRLLYCTHIEGKGSDLLEVCRLDLEGIVAKWKGGAYLSGGRDSWSRTRRTRR